MLTLNSGHTVSDICHPDLVRLTYLELPREVVGRGHCWFSTIEPWTPPIARLRTQPLRLHQAPDSISAAFLSQLTQVIVNFAVAVYTSAFQPSVFDQAKQTLIFFCSGRLRLGQPGVIAAGVHLEGLAKAPHRVISRVLLDEGVLQPHSLAKYAAAFFKMSRSSVTRLSSARSLRSSAC